jgi:hypothetical protein
VRGRLTPRVVIASGLLAVLVGAALRRAAVGRLQPARFQPARAALLRRAGAGRRLERRADRRRDGPARLRPHARAALPRARSSGPAPASRSPGARADRLADDAGPAEAGLRIAGAGESYTRRLRGPARARGADATTRVPAASRLTAEGKRRMDAVRALFRRYERTEALAGPARPGARPTAAARRAVAGRHRRPGRLRPAHPRPGGWFLRAVVLPVRRAAAMAAGSPAATCPCACRRPVSGEIGELERAFNTMGDLAGAQPRRAAAPRRRAGALRRVATLVAAGVSPDRLYAAVAAEVARSSPPTRRGSTTSELDGTEAPGRRGGRGRRQRDCRRGVGSLPPDRGRRPSLGRIAVGWRGTRGGGRRGGPPGRVRRPRRHRHRQRAEPRGARGVAARGSWRRATRRAGGSSATSTTAPSSGSCRSRSPCRAAEARVPRSARAAAPGGRRRRRITRRHGRAARDVARPASGDPLQGRPGARAAALARRSAVPVDSTSTWTGRCPSAWRWPPTTSPPRR